MLAPPSAGLGDAGLLLPSPCAMRGPPESPRNLGGGAQTRGRPVGGRRTGLGGSSGGSGCGGSSWQLTPTECSRCGCALSPLSTQKEKPGVTPLPPLAPAVPRALLRRPQETGLSPGPVPKPEQLKQPVHLCRTQCQPPSVLPGRLARWLWVKRAGAVGRDTPRGPRAAPSHPRAALGGSPQASGTPSLQKQSLTGLNTQV